MCATSLQSDYRIICDVESNPHMSILLDSETEVRTEVIQVDVVRSDFIGAGTRIISTVDIAIILL